MSDPDLDKLIEQDERLDSGTRQLGQTDHAEDTQIDEGLNLLHRVRHQWSAWPASDPALDASNGALTENLLWTGSTGPPESLGRFKIQYELGRGGFGIVLLAHDPKLQQDVALKIPTAESFLSLEARQRMAREARAATILAHPAIVPVYEVGELGTASYISYGYCAGPSLAEWLVEHRSTITPTLAAMIISRLAEAVQHAHARKIIHRDLKPSNILLERTPESEESLDHAELIDALRVGDFGLARVDSMRSDISRSGIPLGTPAYMSPEQARGATDVGPATDIFALGAMLYELLTGAAPFRRDNDVATLRAIESEPHAPISGSHAPKDLIAICDNCLQKRPEDRYASAQAVHDDLQRFLTGKPVMARPVNRVVRLSRWCRRNQALTAALVLAALSLLVGSVASTIFAIRASQKASEAQRHAGYSSAAVQNLLTAIADEPSLVNEDLEEFRSKLHTSALQYYEAIHEERPTDHEQAREYYKTLSSLARLQRLMGQHESAAEMYGRAAELTKSMPEGLDSRRAFALAKRNQSRDILATGHHADAVGVAEEGISALDPLSDDRDELNSLAEGLTEVAIALSRQGDIARAETYVNRALEVGERFTKHEPLRWPTLEMDQSCITLAKALRTKAEICSQLKQTETLPDFAKATLGMFAAIRNKMPQHELMCLSSSGAIHHLIGNHWLGLEEWDTAEREFQRQVDLINEIIEIKPDNGFVYSNLLNAAYHLGLVEYRRGDDAKCMAITEPLLQNAADYIEQFPNHTRALQFNKVDLLILRSNLYLRQDNRVLGKADLESAADICEGISDMSQPSAALSFRLRNIRASLEELESAEDVPFERGN